MEETNEAASAAPAKPKQDKPQKPAGPVFVSLAPGVPGGTMPGPTKWTIKPGQVLEVGKEISDVLAQTLIKRGTLVVTE